MNKRIKELWVEGTGSTWPRPGKFTAGEYDYNLEKFAELIIKECTAIMDKNNVLVENTYDDYDNGWNSALFCVINEVEQHFGIKQ